MDACLSVEQELVKALTRFQGLGEHSERILTEAIQQITLLKRELSEVPEDYELSDTQIQIVKDRLKRCKETIGRLATEHRDAHSCVSKVGKVIDRNFVAEFGAVAPRAAQFYTNENQTLIDQAVAQHLYRQGLDTTAEIFCREANIEIEPKGEPFAALTKIATKIIEGDPSSALDWVNKHSDGLKNSPLPFILHRLAFFEIATRVGNSAAVQYAKANFPQFSQKHERDIQRAMCFLAYTNTDAPKTYNELKDRASLAVAAADLFIREACVLLQMAPLSPLAGAVLAGGRVLPALLDIRAKLSHPQASAWANTDELPVEVDTGGDGGSYHSVFACPILRQQASDQNPPMRLLCGHVISRDALTKLVQGKKLKCPYCPTEQAQSQARQIYF